MKMAARVGRSNRNLRITNTSKPTLNFYRVRRKEALGALMPWVHTPRVRYSGCAGISTVLRSLGRARG